MSDKQNKKSIKEQIVEAIKDGRIKMRPKWHFILKTALIFTGIVMVILALLYLASFVIFILRQTGVWFLPTFGFRGIFVFLFSLPWLLILLGIFFVLILEFFVRRYSFAYKKPVLYSILVLFAFVFITSFIISRTAFHRNFFMAAREGSLPIAGQFYRGYGMPPGKSFHVGTITEITDDGFQIETPTSEILSIMVTSETSFPMGVDFQTSDRVVVLGDREDYVVKALGVRRIDGMGMAENMMRERRRGRDRGWFIPNNIEGFIPR